MDKKETPLSENSMDKKETPQSENSIEKKADKPFSINSQLLKKDAKSMLPFLAILGAYLVIAYIFHLKVCVIYNITGFPCPGCGTTRAVVALLKLNFAEAFVRQPFLYVMIIYALAFLFCRYFIARDFSRLFKIGIYVIFAGLVILYIVRMIMYFPNQEPYVYNYNSLFYRIYSIISKLLT